jgi:competence ComEA-like helix-hairpin-helix protein
MILTPEERRALLGLLGLLLLGQGVSLLRDERKARPDRELSAWLTREQAARAESLSAVSDLPGVQPGALPGVAQAAIPEVRRRIVPGAGYDGKPIVTKSVDEIGESAFDAMAAESIETGLGAEAMKPVPIESATDIPAGVASTGRIAINRASARDLEALPGIGPALAKRIVEEREKAGPYRSPRDLLRVHGIGPKKQAAIQDRIDWS